MVRRLGKVGVGRVQRRKKVRWEGACVFFFFWGEEKFVVKYKNYRLF